MNMTPHQATNILSHLEKLKRLSEGRYIALCPCHNDSKPSLNVTIKPDGVIVMHCFSCQVNGLAICDALGIEPSALFPQTDNVHYEKQKRIGFSCWQLLHALEKDLLAVLIAAKMLVNGEILPQSDVDYLSEVVIRLGEAFEYLEGTR